MRWVRGVCYCCGRRGTAPGAERWLFFRLCLPFFVLSLLFCPLLFCSLVDRMVAVWWCWGALRWVRRGVCLLWTAPGAERGLFFRLCLFFFYVFFRFPHWVFCGAKDGILVGTVVVHFCFTVFRVLSGHGRVTEKNIYPSIFHLNFSPQIKQS